MRADAFVDTNILLYAISTAPDEATKKKRAREILARQDWGLSVQVLQEFYVNATRPPHPAMMHDDAEAAIRQLLLRPVVVADAVLLLEGMRLKRRFQLAYWDAAIVAAALSLNATVLYSEDMQHGQRYDNVRIVNPFWSEAAPG